MQEPSYYAHTISIDKLLIVVRFRNTLKIAAAITVRPSKRFVVLSVERAAIVSQANVPPESQACSLATTIKITLVQNESRVSGADRFTECSWKS